LENVNLIDMRPIKYEDEEVTFTFSDEGAEWYGKFEDKPETEQILFLLQDDFYAETSEHKRQKIWSKMFSIVQGYSRSLILKRMKGTNRYRDINEIDDDATQTALSFMSQYITRPGYRVGASFAGMINPKVLETLYKYSKEDSHASLHCVVGDTNLEFGDLQEKIKFESLYANEESSYEEKLDEVDLKKIVNKTIKEFLSEVPNEATQMKLMFYLLLLLRKSKNKHSKLMFLKHIVPSKEEYDLIQLFELELHNRLEDALS